MIYDHSFAAIFLLLFTFSSCQPDEEKKGKTLFNKVSSKQTGIDFENRLKDTDDFNIIEYLYYYNGAGVAIGDINNDGLTDLYFSANQQSNKLYLNKGNFKFEDITDRAGVAGMGNWKTGVSMADVNGDGLLDIFICGVGKYKKFDGYNQLLINKGDLTFEDQTNKYGLNFQGFSTQSTFFDYDNDGDLDMFLVNHSVHTSRSYGKVELRNQSDPLAGDKLYRNDIIPQGTAHFTEVTSIAGIHNSQIGYGLSVAVSDLNNDGWLDIYVCNDFHENDYLYMNNGDGTFRQELERLLGHSTRFSMGSDIGDVNNDGWNDIVTLDMQPKDEGVIKTTAGEDSYDIFEFKLRFGYHYQFARNALQLNQGLDAAGNLMFSDIASLSGLEATDWSWSSLLADFDNDGYKDLFITNGINRRPNDLDYINFISSDSAQLHSSDKQFVEKMPSGTVPDYLFRNNGDLTFELMNGKWMDNQPDLSNGAAYADLDNDGDLDIVVNHLNQKASVYRNNLKGDSLNYLKFELKGSSLNTSGIGSKIIVYGGENRFHGEQILSRGWMSSVDPVVHVGLGNIRKADSVMIVWPDGKYQTLHGIKSNQKLTIRYDEAGSKHYPYKGDHLKPFLKPIPQEIFKHHENYFVPFNTERLMPHAVSTQGPKMSTGDVNNDGLEDFFIGGAKGQSGELFIQNRNSSFNKIKGPWNNDAPAEDTGSILFDADNDKDLDLLVVSGGQELNGAEKTLLPRLYINRGGGVYVKTSNNLPEIFLNASCVKAFDFDNDNDQDLFIGGRVIPGRYGISPSSYLLSNNGKGVFTDVSKKSGFPNGLGLVTDAIPVDLNSDGRQDLIVVGEWMPITVLIQGSSGVFQNQTSDYGLAETSGLWNTIIGTDFDKDGDTDFVAGNLGLNSRLKATKEKPLELIVGDIDNNGGYEQLLVYYNDGEKYPFVSRDLLVKQIPSLKRKFLKYADFRNVKVGDIIPGDQLKKFVHLRAEMLSSVYLENKNDKRFEIKILPVEAQCFPIFALCAADINADGQMDILGGGNLFTVQPEFGRYDAGLGFMMLGDKKEIFRNVPLQVSGFILRGEVRDIKSSLDSQGIPVYFVARNNDSLLIFKHK